MPDPAVILTLDHAQPRLRRDRQQTTVTGGVRGDGADYVSQWQSLLNENVFVDPGSFRAFLLPAFFDPLWATTGTGSYARLRKTDYTDEFGVALGTNWREDAVLHASDYYLLSVGGTSEEVWTKDTWERNRGFGVTFFQYTTGTDDVPVLNCGYAAPGQTSAESTLSFRLYASGRVEVWRYGVIDGEGSISGTSNSRGPDAQGQDNGPRFVRLFIMPCCVRDVLILSTQGGGFVHTCSDIAEDALPEESIITPLDSKFWWYVPVDDGETVTAKVQAAPAWFATDGILAAQRSIFLRPPEIGSSADVTVYADLTTQPGDNSAEGRLVHFDDIGADFTADGSEGRARIRVDLAGDGIGSPVAHAGTAVFETESVDTDASEALAVLDYCRALSLSIDDGLPGNRVQLELGSPDALESAGAALIRDLDCRPVKVELATFWLHDGQAGTPEFQDEIDDAVKRVKLDVRDFTRQMEEYEYSDNVPLDGIDVGDAHVRIARDAGIPEDRLDIRAAAYDIPGSGTQSKGDWNTQIQVADKALDWQSRLHETYSGRSFFGVVPVESGPPVLQLILEDAFETEPDITLYDNDDQAYAVLVSEGYSTSEAARLRFTRVFRSFKSQAVPCLANQLWVTGQDPRTRRPVIATRNDDASQDPALPPSGRPRNWVGGLRKYGVVDPTLTTDEAIGRVADLMFPRLTKAPRTCEFTCELLLLPSSPVVIWKSRVVALVRSGATTKWRIQSFSAQHIKEPSSGDNWRWRPARYIATQIEEEDGISESGHYELGGAHHGLAGVVHRRSLMRHSRRKVRRGGEHLVGPMPFRVLY